MKKNYDVSVKLADVLLDVSLYYPETEKFFSHYIYRGCQTPVSCISINEDEVDMINDKYPLEQRNAFTEYSELVNSVSETLLMYDRFCIHGLAYIWNGKAFLLTGPSGVGKTTQYRNWKKLYGDEIRILNGDKPIFEFRDDHEIWVHPSPWMGKERYGSMRTAPLAGIICLTQSDQNAIRRMAPSECVHAILPQIFSRMFTEENCHRICRLTERLIGTIPFWELSNLGDLASSRLAHDTLLQELEEIT